MQRPNILNKTLTKQMKPICKHPILSDKQQKNVSTCGKITSNDFMTVGHRFPCKKLRNNLI